MELWICGQYKSGETPNVVWDFQGVFSNKQKAIDACIDKPYFIAPAILDKMFPEETIVWP
jgi:hypothetical protein